MIYKKFKDYKLEVVKMIFEQKTTAEILSYIETLEQKHSITPSQITNLVDIVHTSARYRLTSKNHKYKSEILVYRWKIIASYLPDEGVYLE